MDIREIREKIAEVLIQTQFAYWVDISPKPKTAEEINTQQERAVEYYLCRFEKRDQVPPYEQTRFHHIIELQLGLIMRILDQALQGKGEVK